MKARDLVEEAVVLCDERFARCATPKERFDRLRKDLADSSEKVSSEERSLVEELEARWGELAKAAFSESEHYDDLRVRLKEASEPALLPVGFLDLLGRAHKETLHTQALGTFL